MISDRTLVLPIADLILESLPSIRQPRLNRDSLIAGDWLWPGGAELDSLERLAAATAVSRFFDLTAVGTEDLLLAHPQLSRWASLVSQSFALSERWVCFTSSGSTGMPTTHRHRVSALLHEVSDMGDILPSPKRIVLTTPAHHIYGFLWGAVWASLADVPLVSLRGRLPSAWGKTLKPGDGVVSVPSLLSVWADAVGDVPADLTVLTSTQMLSADVWRQLQGEGISQIYELYGSTETGGIGWRRQPETPFQLMPSLTRSDNDTLTKDRKDLPAETIPIPDFVQWIGEQAFHVTARRDLLVKIYGQRVSIDHVRQVLLTHPSISQASVRQLPASQGGKLKVFVVPAAAVRPVDTTALIEQLRSWVAGRLRPHECPGHWTIGPTLPVTDTGKPADWLVSSQ